MRATIDLDDPTEMQIIRAWNQLEEFGDGTVYGRVSSSGSGIHLKVHGCDPPSVERAREVCGDDTRRMEFDENSHLKPKQILFSRKSTGAGASEWNQFMESVLAEYRRRAPLSVRYPALRTPRI